MIVETIMVPATSRIDLVEQVPRALLKAMDLLTYGYAHLVVTDNGDDPGALTDDEIFARAKWTGILRYMDNGLHSLYADTPDILFGDQDGKAQFVYVGPDLPVTQDFEAHLDDYLGVSNGLTKGQVLDDTAGTFKVKAISGATPRDLLMSALRRAPNGPFEYRVNPDFTVDTGLKGSLYDSGQVIVTKDPGGRTGSIIGLQAPGLQVESRDIRDWRNHQFEDWKSDHTLYGEASSAAPSGYRAADGTALEIQAVDGTNILITSNVRNWARIGALLLDAQAEADDDAAAILDANNDVREQVAIEIDVDDPHRYMRPGDTIYAYDPEGQIYDLSADPLQYRGEPTFPKLIRFTGWEWPLKRGRHKVLFHRYRSGAWEWIDLTRWIKWETGPTRLTIGARRRSIVNR